MALDCHSIGADGRLEIVLRHVVCVSYRGRTKTSLRAWSLLKQLSKTAHIACKLVSAHK